MAEENNRGFKGVWIPKVIWDNEELNLMEKILLVEIDSLDQEKGCFAKNQHFADFLGISKTQVSKYITELENKGMIERESFDGRRRILRSKLGYGIVGEDDTPLRKVKGSLKEKERQPTRKVKGSLKEKLKGGNSPDQDDNGNQGSNNGSSSTSSSTVTNTKETSLSKKYNSNTPLTAKGIDYNAVKETWNQGVPENLQIRTVTSKRKKHLRARFKEELFDLDAIIDALTNQPFCLGENDRGWIADFNWIIKNDENYVKVLEYNYGSDDNNGNVDQLDGLKSKYGGG